jgi:hypothetical protein
MCVWRRRVYLCTCIPPPCPKPIERVERLSPNDFCDDYLTRMQPAIIPGGIAHWPAVERWSDAYLRENAGGTLLRVKPRADYIEGESKRESESESELELGEILALMSAECPPERCYARESTLLAKARTLRSDVLTPQLLTETLPHATPRSGDGGPYVWLGPAHTVAQLHWDPEHNLFGQVRGRKYVILVPPGDASLTYPNMFTVTSLARKQFFLGRGASVLKSLQEVACGLAGIDEHSRTIEYRHALRHRLTISELSLLCDYLLEANNCHVDAQTPDIYMHPQFLMARRYHATLNPGDLLFVPYFWHHYIRSLDASISVNWFFLQDSLKMRLGDDWIVSILLGHLAP